MAELHDIDEIRELLVPYALRQLTAGEQSRVEQALAADPSLRAELDGIEQAGARLVQGGVPRVAAPSALKSRVLDAVQAGANRPIVPAVEPAPEPALAPVVPISTAPKRRWRLAPVLAGGLAAACLVLALVAVNLSSDLDAAQSRADRLAAKAAEQGGPPAGFEGASMFPVGTTGPMKDSTASLIRVSDDKWLLIVDSVPSPGAGNSWQVWTADSKGNIKNIDQWDSEAPKGIVVVDSADIREVMISHEKSTKPMPTPSTPAVADVKV